MLQDIKLSPVIDYQISSNGELVTQRSFLDKLTPSNEALPESQLASIDWTLRELFGDRESAIRMIESLIVGHGINANEKWIQFALLYRKWQLDYQDDLLPSPPNLNQVALALNFDTSTFLSQFQKEVNGFMSTISQMKASLSSLKVIDNLTDKATSIEADVKEIELHLKVSGILQEKSGININMQQNNVTTLKSDKEKLKAPLLQFSQTVEHIDNEVRS